MSPYEIIAPGGSVEHLNPEAGEVWLKRAVDDLAAQRLDQPDPAGALGLFAVDASFPLFDGRMFALTPDGIEAAMRALSH